MIINLTPHTITVILEDGVKTFPAAEKPARLIETREAGNSVDGIRTNRTLRRWFKDDLPEEKYGVYYIVSHMYREAVLPFGQRHDLLVPDDIVRDEEGKIIGCRAFSI